MIFQSLATDSLILAKMQAVITEYGTANILLAVLAIAATALVADYAHMLYRHSQMPPGPFPWPIVGNTFSLPDNKPWIYFEELSKTFNSPIITFWIGRFVDPPPSSRQPSTHPPSQQPNRVAPRRLDRTRDL